MDDVPDIAGNLTLWHGHDNLCFDPTTGRLSGRFEGTNCIPGGRRPDASRLARSERLRAVRWHRPQRYDWLLRQGLLTPSRSRAARLRSPTLRLTLRIAPSGTRTTGLKPKTTVRKHAFETGAYMDHRSPSNPPEGADPSSHSGDELHPLGRCAAGSGRQGCPV